MWIETLDNALRPKVGKEVMNLVNRKNGILKELVGSGNNDNKSLAKDLDEMFLALVMLTKVNRKENLYESFSLFSPLQTKAHIYKVIQVI